jgi:hypothetical protein
MAIGLTTRLGPLDSAGPEADAARFAGRRMSPAEAIAVVRGRRS